DQKADEQSMNEHGVIVGSDFRDGTTVIISEELANIRRDIRRDVLLQLGALGVLGVVSAGIVNLVLLRIVAVPLRQLQDIMDDIGGRNFGAQTSPRGSLEMQQLVEAVNAMSHRLLESDRQRQQQMRTAKQIQEYLLPNGQQIPGLQATHLFDPADNVAGDYYDFLPFGDGSWLICVANVTGHGVPAAKGAAMLKSMLLTVTEQAPADPVAILNWLNRWFVHTILPGQFSVCVLHSARKDADCVERSNGVSSVDAFRIWVRSVTPQPARIKVGRQSAVVTDINVNHMMILLREHVHVSLGTVPQIRLDSQWIVKVQAVAEMFGWSMWFCRGEGRRLSVIAFLVVIMIGISSSTASAQPSRQILDQVAIVPQIGTELPLDLVFRDHKGDDTTLQEALDGQPAVLCLVYFQCPMLCKLAADGLVRSLADMEPSVGKDVQVVLVSFDHRDTPQQAATTREQLIHRYARTGTEDGWYCLTGDESAIQSLTNRVGFHYVWDEETKQYAHAAGLFLISPKGIITDCLNGVEFTPKQLASAIAAAKQGVLNEQAFSGEEPVSFLRCYLYDPTTGKFGAVVQWTVRILGIATVIVLAGGVTLLIRRQRISQLPASSD
ncbi:MAG: SCO family protein, partial [Planctomycetaceae bacterium]|nr:SCO family protein [Planctomycetaceae bacterium]